MQSPDLPGGKWRTYMKRHSQRQHRRLFQATELRREQLHAGKITDTLAGSPSVGEHAHNHAESYERPESLSHGPSSLIK